jgi:hypothetical protein
MSWKLLVELMFISPALLLCFAGLIVETREQVRVAKRIRKERRHD